MWLVKNKGLKVQKAKNSTENIRFYSRDELMASFVNSKMEVAKYEVIIDSLFMSKLKDDDWKEKIEAAAVLYDEAKDISNFLNHLWHEINEEDDKKTSHSIPHHFVHPIR